MVARKESIDRVLQVLRDEGPFAEQDLLALNAAVADVVSRNKDEAAKLIHRERTALYRRLRWYQKLMRSVSATDE